MRPADIEVPGDRAVQGHVAATVEGDQLMRLVSVNCMSGGVRDESVLSLSRASRCGANGATHLLRRLVGKIRVRGLRRALLAVPLTIRCRTDAGRSVVASYAFADVIELNFMERSS